MLPSPHCWCARLHLLHPDHLIHHHLLALSFQGHGLPWVNIKEMFGFPINNFTDEDAVVFCFGGALDSLCGVNCIPGNGIRNPVFTTQVPGDDRPAMNAYAYPDRNTRVRFQFAVDPQLAQVLERQSAEVDLCWNDMAQVRLRFKLSTRAVALHARSPKFIIALLA